MVDNEDPVLPSDKIQKDSSEKGSVVDMMLGKSDEKVIDSETMIQETQKRIWSSLKMRLKELTNLDREIRTRQDSWILQ